MINEIFDGIQGEGKTQGQFRTFIRFNGCSLSCNFCDSAYTWGKGDQNISVEDYKTPYPALVLTGGEPCLKENWEYINKTLLNEIDYNWIEIETNGTVIPDFIHNNNPFDLWNISPKNPKDMVQEIHKSNCDPILLAIKDRLNDYIVKFVIKDNNDLKFIHDIQSKYKVPDNKIWLMPFTNKDGSQNSEEVFDMAFSYKYNYSARLHVLIKGNKRGI